MAHLVFVVYKTAGEFTPLSSKHASTEVRQLFDQMLINEVGAAVCVVVCDCAV